MLTPELTYTYWLPFIWGLVVLSSFIGWGSAIAQGLRLSEVDWGLRAAWGVAFLTAVGGLLAYLSLASRPALFAVVIAGAIIYVCSSCLANTRNNTRQTSAWLGVLAILALIAIWYAPAVSLHKFNGCDDDIAYFTFAKRILESGTLIEPFSLRRLAGYGGQSFLQALVWCLGSQKNMNLLDMGICEVILGGLLYGYIRSLAVQQRYAMIATGLCLLLPIQRINIMSHCTGVVLLLALLRTTDMALRSGSWRMTALVGLIGAGACSLRGFYIPAVFLACSLSFIAAPRCERLSRRALRVIVMLAVTAACLVPWALLLRASSGSYIYPLMHGNHQATVETYSLHLGFIQELFWLGNFFVNPHVLFLVIPTLLVAYWTRQRVTLLFGVASAVVSAMIVLALTYSNFADLFRYTQPMLLSSFFASVLTIPTSWAVVRQSEGRRVLFVCMAGYLIVGGVGYAVFSTYWLLTHLASLPAQVHDTGSLFSRPEIDDYRNLQARVPLRAAMFAVVSEPSLFSYGDGSIFNADVIGASSLPPGMPFFHGPSAVKAYLKSHRIDYIAYTDFETVQCLYNRARWRVYSTRGDDGRTPAAATPCHTSPSDSPQQAVEPMVSAGTLMALWKVHARYYLDLMNNIEQLAETEQLMFCGNRLRLIKLK